MLTATAAIKRLQTGNQRFAAELPSNALLSSQARRQELMAGQEPFAIILGCSDSRVPVEIIFDQGLGDLFVIRVAGNIVQPATLGSIEYAAKILDTKLVVVLGHSMCGAVQATLKELEHPTENFSPNLHAIVDCIRPSVEELMQTDLQHDKNALIQHAVRANIRASVKHLRQGSQILEQLIKEDGLLIVGAEYSLETGVVDFFDRLPDEY